MFAWLISRTFSANEHYFSLTTNQPTVLSAIAYQPSEQDINTQPISSSMLISILQLQLQQRGMGMSY